MASRSTIAYGLVLQLAVAACDAAMPSTVTMVDSAGVTVVTNLAGSVEQAAAWSLASNPSVDIGSGAEPAIPLYRVTAVTPLESGHVAVGTTVPPQVRVFDREGSLRATLGREGQGPGEFLSVGSVLALGPDAVGVWDPDRRRLSVFTEGGALAREVDLSAVAPVSARASSNTQAASGFTHLLPSLPGSLVLFGEAALGPGEESVISRHDMPAHRVASDGAVLASYGSFPGMETSPGIAAPFGARTHAASTNGDLVVGTSEATEYRTYAPGGALVRLTRWPDHERSVGGPFLDRWLAMLEAEEEALAEYILSSPRPERFPAYDDILATEDGDVWVAEYPGPLGLIPLRRADPAPEALKPTRRMPARRWLVFDSEGVLKATVTTPDGFEPYMLQADLLWGVHTDELDVESVRAYALVRG